MTNAATSGFAAVLADILNWLKIYRQRAFWVQIGATVSAVLLWVPFIMGDLTPSLLINLIAAVGFLCSIATNIVWAWLRKSYSCVIGTITGFGLYYMAWSALVPASKELMQILFGLLMGFLNGALFGYMAFLVFAISGLIHFPRKRRLGLRSTDEDKAKTTEAKEKDDS